MAKAYLKRYEIHHERQPDMSRKIDVWFGSRIENAMYWETREEAEGACVMFDNYQIRMASSEGGTFICSGFQVEQRAPEEFVIQCEGPFINISI